MSVLDRFAAAGIRFRLEGDAVIATLTAPVSDEIRAALREAKAEIVAALRAAELTDDDHELLDQARVVLGWSDADIDDWLHASLPCDPHGARVALRELIEIVAREKARR